jgi:uncharacterized protein
MSQDLSPVAARAWSIFEALGDGDVDGALANFADDGSWWINAIRQEVPLPVMRQLMGRLFDYAPMKFTLHRAITEGDVVALDIESHADTRDGTHYNGAYAFVVEVKNDRVTSVREHADTKHAFDIIPPEVLMGPSSD